MRVIAGIYRSRILKSLAGNALRPTSDRLRETLFNVLGDSVNGGRFLDVFAGTGAIGIEALSRGALEVAFIENHGPAAKLIKRNLESLGIKSAATILPLDAIRALEKLETKATSFDFIFVDPPYAASEDYLRVLRFLGASSLLAPNCVAIAEHRRDFALPETFGILQRSRILKQGDAALSFYRISHRPTENAANKNNS